MEFGFGEKPSLPAQGVRLEFELSAHCFQKPLYWLGSEGQRIDRARASWPEWMRVEH